MEMKENTVSLYPGIRIYFSGAGHMISSPPTSGNGEIMEIHYCRTGKFSWITENGEQICLEPGNFLLYRPDIYKRYANFSSTPNYEYLKIYLNFNELSKNPPDPLAGTGICYKMFCEKYLNNKNCFYFSGNTQTEAIFSAFYEQPESLSLSYQKIKSIELLLYLSQITPDNSKRQEEYKSEQEEIIHKVHDYLTQHIAQRITIDELARLYLINPTTLKTVFKSVYGNSLASHIKEHRMELAAGLLLKTDLSIAQISKQVGYESQSKFTAAFKTFYKISPTEYRKKHKNPFS